MTTPAEPRRRPRLGTSRRPRAAAPRPPAPAGPGRRALRPALRARRLRGGPGGRPPGPADATPWCARPSPPSSTWPTGGPPAARRTAATAPGSSSRCPTTSTPEVVGFDLPAPRPLRHRHRLPVPRRRRGGRRPYGRSASWPGRRGSTSSAGGTSPSTTGSLGLDLRGGHAVDAPGLRGPGRRARRSTGDDPALALDRLAFVLRKRAEHEIDDCYFGLAVGPDHRLQGHAHLPPAGRVLPRPVRRAADQRAGPGPLPLLHQHLPVVAAGPSLPLPGPQRRDQHPGRQPQLDAGPRGAVPAPT